MGTSPRPPRPQGVAFRITLDLENWRPLTSYFCGFSGPYLWMELAYQMQKVLAYQMQIVGLSDAKSALKSLESHRFLNP